MTSQDRIITFLRARPLVGLRITDSLRDGGARVTRAAVQAHRADEKKRATAPGSWVTG